MSENESCQIYAHSRDGFTKKDWQTLSAHCKGVAELAASFGRAFHAEALCYETGLLHDIGKANADFQRRLEGSPVKVDHSIVGAAIAKEHYGFEGALMAPAIAGHHGGMPNWSDAGGSRTPLASRLNNRDAAKNLKLCAGFARAIDTNPDRTAGTIASMFSRCSDTRQKIFSLFVLTKLLHSALVDADWLDTERFMDPQTSSVRSAEMPSIKELSSRLDNYMQELMAQPHGTESVRVARNLVLNDCRAAAKLPTGIFTLEVPTGGGKTLSSLRFAINHALQNGQDRIIYAIPFTSIVEQTAHVFKQVFGPESVLEHHSNYDYGQYGENDVALRERLLVQNWDAKLIVTTNVQLLESLFSSKTSKSRKVHNIANSVIVLDEAQTLPDRLLTPTLAMLETLSQIANVTIVMCTATQPSLESQWPSHIETKPIVRDQEALEMRLGNRTLIDIDRIFDGRWSQEHGKPSDLTEEVQYGLDDLTRELSSERQVLCIVNSRRAARLIYEELVSACGGCDDIFHLSALMVPAHRAAVLGEIRSRLHDGMPCRVVSTQLIEAGVDVDFPSVFRELTGLDSILQAAGRCNREGKLEEPGIVRVFECEELLGKPNRKQTWLEMTKSYGREMIDWAVRREKDPFGHESIRRYFEKRYSTVASSIGSNMYSSLTNMQIMSQSTNGSSYDYLCEFESVSQQFKIIDDDQMQIIVPWGAEGELLAKRIESEVPSRDLYSALQRFSVSVPTWLEKPYKDSGVIRVIGEFNVLETACGSASFYDDALGLCAPGEEAEPPEVLVY